MVAGGSGGVRGGRGGCGDEGAPGPGEPDAFCEGALEGTLLPEQVQGDCASLVCDGAGRRMLAALESDTPDDGNPCTVDTCAGTTPQHTAQTEVACYSGAEGTEGVGRCQAGVQQCDAAGQPVGGCEGEVLPAVESCAAGGVDDDCDGLVDEEASPAVCGDGCTAADEACDDGNTSNDDGCTSTCLKEEVLVMSLGGSHACAILHDGRVKCWGYNGSGRLGLGDTLDRGDGPGEMGDSLPAVNLGTAASATLVGASLGYSCARLAAGNIKCWGTNEYSQLGVGGELNRGTSPADMGDNLPAVKLYSSTW
ncbi:regulator of chromosome condensation, RCC1 [Chondromyces apiculatus DSM 436]|uniref:Regulator of chromosome condensation, RCC1 n=1 Tax=Chondromyces apiculatus DSM 436 TaxID=1192034 RepID=A0A017TF40_9BACT|nr:regulator of chromosome condensation, RCC1 [Chondromyces apiculatus DSM 436]